VRVRDYVARYAPSGGSAQRTLRLR